MEIYSFAGTKFNALAYCMIRAFYVPELEGLEQKDTWFAVPAMQMGGIINLAYAKIENASIMTVDSNGRVIKAFRINEQMPPLLEGYELEQIKLEAFSIPAWEQVNQSTFPYELMFDKNLMVQRYGRTGHSTSTVMSGTVHNEIYNQAYGRIKRTCATCGGGQ